MTIRTILILALTCLATTFSNGDSGDSIRLLDNAIVVLADKKASHSGDLVSQEVLASETSHPIIALDKDIAPYVAALNKAGIYTRRSCGGHGRHAGYIQLQNGYTVIIAPPNQDLNWLIERYGREDEKLTQSLIGR